MIFYIDIDGVLCNNTWGKYDEADPIYENIEKINRKYEQGHKIILWTSRGGTTGIDWREVTEKQMEKWGVRYHELSFDKPNYDYIIDDKALNIEEVD